MDSDTVVITGYYPEYRTLCTMKALKKATKASAMDITYTKMETESHESTLSFETTSTNTPSEIVHHWTFRGFSFLFPSTIGTLSIHCWFPSAPFLTLYRLLTSPTTNVIMISTYIYKKALCHRSVSPLDGASSLSMLYGRHLTIWGSSKCT